MLADLKSTWRSMIRLSINVTAPARQNEWSYSSYGYSYSTNSEPKWADTPKARGTMHLWINDTARLVRKEQSDYGYKPVRKRIRLQSMMPTKGIYKSSYSRFCTINVQVAMPEIWRIGSTIDRWQKGCYTYTMPQQPSWRATEPLALGAQASSRNVAEMTIMKMTSIAKTK